MEHPNQHRHHGTCGVYQIRNIQTGELYIGCSKNVGVRWGPHVSLLRNNRHHSSRLQAAWNEYGEENFALEIVEQCDKSSLRDREKHWIETLEPIYNGPNGCLGMDEESRLRKRKRQSVAARRRGISKAQQKKMQAALRERLKRKPRAKTTDETRQRMSKSHRIRLKENGGAKLNVEQVREIRAKLDAGQLGKDLARQYGVSPSVISDIKNGKLWQLDKIEVWEYKEKTGDKY